jgi:copper homeostasis protein
MMAFLFELCAETLQTAQAAELGGADRIELCERLDIGGVTPGEKLISDTIQALSIPVHVLIRPRGGDFIYSGTEFEQMKEQVQWVKQAGAAGVALGVLLADGRVDVDRSRELVKLARPMKVTFHRAFDRTPDMATALEAVIATGADCQLTSGGAPDVLSGAKQLKILVKQAGDRIQIMAGGGLRLASIVEVLEQTGLHCLHGSLTRRAGDGIPESETAEGQAEILQADVRTAVRLMRGHFAAEMIWAQKSQGVV